MAWLERNRLIVLAVAGAALLAGFLARDLTADRPPALVLQGEPSGGSVLVHVAGAVGAPGLYELPAGARLQDAVTAAGGPSSNADLAAINPARRLRDGEQVLVPGRPAVADSAPRPGEKLDLNAATADQLETLPGIGEAYSRRIVDSRRADGPYATVDDLMARRVVPAATFEKIRDLVTVLAP